MIWRKKPPHTAPTPNGSMCNVGKVGSSTSLGVGQQLQFGQHKSVPCLTSASLIPCLYNQSVSGKVPDASDDLFHPKRSVSNILHYRHEAKVKARDTSHPVKTGFETSKCTSGGENPLLLAIAHSRMRTAPQSEVQPGPGSPFSLDDEDAAIAMARSIRDAVGPPAPFVKTNAKSVPCKISKQASLLDVLASCDCENKHLAMAVSLSSHMSQQSETFWSFVAEDPELQQSRVACSVPEATVSASSWSLKEEMEDYSESFARQRRRASLGASSVHKGAAVDSAPCAPLPADGTQFGQLRPHPRAIPQRRPSDFRSTAQISSPAGTGALERARAGNQSSRVFIRNVKDLEAQAAQLATAQILSTVAQQD
eukprot:2027924-Pleurochrysis_carterae.AAC.2